MKTWFQAESSSGIQGVARGEPAVVSARQGGVRSILQAPPFRLALLVFILAALFGPALVGHIQLSADPLALNDDARQQIYPFLPRYIAGLFPNDYAAAYYLACFPIGFRALYSALASFIDPILISKIVPYALYAITLGALGRASYHLSGWFGSLFTLVFALSSPYVLARLAGGLPRGFGLALVACLLLALVQGRTRWLAFLTVVCAGFYAPAGVLGGISLAAVLMILPRADRGTATSWGSRKRIGVIGMTMLGCILVLLPTLLGSLRYGATLGPGDIAAYPELGPNGRYEPDDRAPFDALPVAVLKMLPEAFRGREEDWSPRAYSWVADFSSGIASMALYQWLLLGICAVICVGLAARARREAAIRRLLVLLGVAAVAYIVSAPLAPTLYLPQRYTAYTVPLIAVVALPAAAHAIGMLGRTRRMRQRLGHAALIGVCGGVFVTTGGLGHRSAGLVRFDDAHQPIYQFVAATSPEATFAVWPGELANNIPYFSHRPVLINYELHQVFHQRYADTMRQRMNALIDAYLATDRAPLRTLRDTFGVRYIIVDERHLRGGTIPGYFAPFDQRIGRAVGSLHRSGGDSILLRLEPRASVFRDGSLFVVDLERIDS